MKKLGNGITKGIGGILLIVIILNIFFGSNEGYFHRVFAAEDLENPIEITLVDSTKVVDKSEDIAFYSLRRSVVSFHNNFGEQLLTMAALTEAERENAYEIYKQIASYEPKSGNLTFYLPNLDGLANKGVQKSAQLAIDAISRDCPEKFWLKGVNSFVYFGNGMISYSEMIEEEYKPVDGFLEKYETALANFEVTGNTRYDRLKSIHDTLCNNNSYVINGIYAHDSYGGLVSYESVCEGYAKAMKVICDRIGIPCILVSGTSYTSLDDTGGNHMWNYVKMDDGKWYAIDVTWDDQNSGIYYDFFLAGSETVPKHFVKMTYAQSHVPRGDISSTGFGQFVYPELSKTAYDPQNATLETPIPTMAPTAPPTIEPTVIPTETPTAVPTETPTVEPTVVPTKIPIPINPTAVPTETPTVEPTVVPTKIPIPINPTAVPTETPTAVPTAIPTGTPTVDPSTAPTVGPTGEVSFYFGDVDKNGKVTADDALVILKHVVKLAVITEELPLELADTDHDNVIGAADALETLKVVVKLKELELLEN